MVDPTNPFETAHAADERGVVPADEHELSPATLADALARIGESVRDYPGIHDLVYEYRRAFRFDPLVARHGDAYYCCVPPRVWPEFADAADLSDAERTACLAVHDRIVHRVVGSDALDGYPEDHDPLVLVA